jgi:hypothetical protein
MFRLTARLASAAKSITAAQFKSAITPCLPHLSQGAGMHYIIIQDLLSFILLTEFSTCGERRCRLYGIGIPTEAKPTSLNI